MAESLSTWAREFAARTPGCVPTGTFFPEASAPTYVEQAIKAGTKVLKAHVQIGGYDPRDELLDPVWGMLAEPVEDGGAKPERTGQVVWGPGPVTGSRRLPRALPLRG